MTDEHITTYAAVLGQVLAKKREKAQLEQIDIAKRLGISQPSWSRIERGGSVISTEQLNIVAQALRTKAHEILKEVDQTIELLNEREVEVVTVKELKQSKDGVGVGTVLVGAALAGFLLALFARK